MFDVKSAARKALEGSIIRSNSGVDMYTPDGKKNYHALWTRDFAYMAHYAGELMNISRIKDCLEYLLSNANENGWIPDRVTETGKAEFTAGFDDFPACENLDNGPFIVIAADAYLRLLPEVQAREFFVKWEKALEKGIECLPKNDDFIIFNDTVPPHSPYGFTDTVCKTGALAMETLLLWHSLKLLVYWQSKFSSENERLNLMKEKIEQSFCKYFVSDSKMLYAATGICRQIDVWASCYMLAIDFPVSKDIKDNIVKWLKENYDGIVYKGQLRHLPAGEYWEKTFVPVEKNTYQNGAFWATPTVWLVKALKDYDFKLAEKTLNDVLDFFEEKGIYECVFEDNCQLEPYVASATNVYGAVKLMEN